MELLPIILTFIACYGIFLFVAYVLARVFFPSIDVEDNEGKPRRMRARNNRRFASR